MNGAPSRNVMPVDQDGTQRRTVPGPRSKAIFDREAEAMAPGLQSIALYSQIVVDRAQGCTIYRRRRERVSRFHRRYCGRQCRPLSSPLR